MSPSDLPPPLPKAPLRRVFLKVCIAILVLAMVVALTLFRVYGVDSHHQSRNSIWWPERGRNLIPPTATDITLQRDLLDHYASKSSSVARPARSDAANPMRELETRFGSDQVRQARRIVHLLQAGHRSRLDKSMTGLDAMTSEWVRQKAEAWGLDAVQAQDLSLVILAEQDGRIHKYKEAFHAMGEDRTAACAEALLLADQVASGELDRDEFEAAHERLSEMDAGTTPPFRSHWRSSRFVLKTVS